ncbi:kinase/pyrophosphorylase [Paenibacillus validus]|uniref:Putative pyruvate, phosphate dikinase regulatory protein n=1 Tax=Paenibacillus validus TaxID=44253 RepID=A0A7X3CT84_9BACL|nr:MULTISPECIES: pyruvate, water dikinase regulatory protein [Paenibacillus]MED4602646.1 kinase/pyrophosphorylase [Paenibacillus validus]MED4608889.1 kinase/pyrophosphorylase [Paenibacillus validus]MUG72550.1 pyruvate, phosphate dikinase/phosphoenolpyruvate synthase regulator [Paenibacillus validus]
MVTMLKPVIFVASDSAGDTGEAVVRAAAVQFDPLQVEIRRVPFLQEITDIDRMIRTVVERNGAIVFTLVIPELRDYLIEEAERAGIVYIDVLGPVIRTLEHTLKQEARHLPGMIHKLDEDYFKKVEAIEFAVKYDDGRDFSGVLQADIVLVGVSRTSKTPLSMYLAHKKFKVANVPLVPEIAPPDQLFTVSSKKIVGLRIDPEKLNVIRTERLKTLGLPGNATYANTARIHKELEFADAVMKRIGCAVIDVSNKAVEETASIIIDIFRSR